MNDHTTDEQARLDTIERDLVAMNFTLTGTTNDQHVIRRGLSMLLFDGLQCIERWTSAH